MSVFHPEDNVAVELTFRKLFFKLWPFLKRYRRNLVISLILVTSYALVGRALPFLFGYAVDRGIRAHDSSLIFPLALTYLLVECFRSFMVFAQSAFIQHFGNQVLFDIREKLIRHIQHLPLPYFDKNPSGRIMTRATTDVFALGELFSQGFASIFICLVEMATIFFSTAVLSWKLTGIILIVIPLLTWICRRISARIRFEFGAAKRKISTLNAFTAESVSGMKILQLFSRQAQALKLFNHLSYEYRFLQLRTFGLFAMLWPTIDAFQMFSLCSSLLIGAYFTHSLGLTVGQLSAYLLLLQSFFKPFKLILEKYNQLQNSLASADRVFQILDEPAESMAGKNFARKSTGFIEFKDVSFQYAAHLPMVLKNVSIRISPGTSVALVGRTGSGKTTMIGLLQRMYEVNKGDILVDGESIRSICLKDLRSRIGVVQQDNFIFSGSFLSNITLEDPLITRERAVWAAEKAHCLDMINRRGGFDAIVHERGSNLSVGERQLLAFARALAFDPEILILDEATANIDSMSEEKMQKALKAVTQGRTSLIIAHRLSTVIGCDQILLLEKGELLQNGPHTKLVSEPGPYQELCRSYFRKTEANL